MWENPRKIFYGLKKCQRPDIRKSYRSLQDLIPVGQITQEGIFCLGEGRYSVTYAVNNCNFKIKTFQEQVSFLQTWCQIQSSLDSEFKLTVFNNRKDMEAFRERVFYHPADRSLRRLADSYNDVIERTIRECRQGIDAAIYLTVTAVRGSLALAKDYFRTLSINLDNALSDIDSGIHLLDADGRLRVLADFYQMGRPEKIYASVEECVENGRDWRNDIVSGSISLQDPGHMVMDGQHVKAFYLDPEGFPGDMDEKFYQKLVNIPYRSLIATDYVPVGKAVAVAMIEQKAAGVDDQIGRQQDKHYEAGHFASEVTMGVQNRKNAIKKKYEKIKSSDLGTFWMGFTIVLIADSKEEMALAEEYVSQVCREATVVMKAYLGRQMEAVNTALVYGCRQASMMRTFSGSEAGIYIPFTVKDCMMPGRPLYYGFHRDSLQPVLIDRKGLTNGNGFVFAPTGYGKSFNGAKWEIGGVMVNATDHVMVMDPSNEYINVAEALGGTVLKFSRESDLCINPFDLDLKKMREGMTKKEMRSLCRDKAHMMFSICQGILEDLFDIRYKNIIERCIREMLYGIAKLPPEEMRVPTMEDFYEMVGRQEEEEAGNLLLCLEMFVHGELDMFNGQTNFDIHNRMVVFSIRDIDEEYWVPAMSVIFDFMTKKVMENKERGIATRLYADEFHIFARNAYTCSYFIICWRTWRKYYGFCTGITQNVSTVLSNPELASLVSNSDYLMLLHQADDDYLTMLEHFSFITEAHRKYLLKAKPGQGIIKAGDNIVPFDNRIDRDCYVYRLFNTNPNELDTA